jgi:hypothetical protein
MPLLFDLHPTAPVTMEDLPKTDTPDVAPTGDAATRRPGASEQIQTSTRGLLVAFAVFTLLAVSSLLLLADHTDRFFAWPIPSRPNSAFLGAAYGAGFVLSVLAVWQRRWSRVRVAVVTVTAFTVLTLIPTVLHKHRLNLMADVASARLVAWVWLTVYVLIPVACVVVVVRQHRQREHGQAPDPGRPMPRRLVALLLAQGTALAALGAVLYAGGAATHMMVAVQRPGWPWPVTPLTSQAIGAWLLSFGFAIALALREGDLSRTFVPAAAYAGFGLFELVVLLSYRTSAGTDGRWLWLDLVVFATLVPTGAYGAWTAHRGSRPIPAD